MPIGRIAQIHLLLLLSLSAQICVAQEAPEHCVPVSQVCVEPAATRIVNGLAVTRDCWAKRTTYACLKPTDSVANGCAALENDAAHWQATGTSPGQCRKIEEACSESITDTDGKTTCLAHTATYGCAQRVPLDSVNAAWQGRQSARAERVDASACAHWSDRAECHAQETICDESGCRRTYVCAVPAARGCSTLQSFGCTPLQEAVCTEGLCTQRFACTRELPAEWADSADITIEATQTVSSGKLAPDTRACEALSNDTTTCRVLSQRCVDTEPRVRVINGRRYRKDCWGWERTLQCTDSSTQSTCQELEAHPACTLVEQTCAAGDCAHETRTYDCGTQVHSPQAQWVAQVTDTDAVVVDTCKEWQENTTCRLQNESCTETDEQGTCRNRRKTFVCGHGQTEHWRDTCDERIAGCSLVQTECVSRDANNRCTLQTHTYVCREGEQTLQTGEVCDGQWCLDGQCTDARHETSTDFLEGVALMEIVRQAGVYSDMQTDAIFSGIASGCTVKVAGWSCCRSDIAEVGTTLANSAMSVALVAGVEAGIELIKTVGSPYVYDMLHAYESTEGILTALYGDALSGARAFEWSHYGLSVAVDSAGSLTLQFSPMGFMARVALDQVGEYFSCTQEDQLHALRNARGLCHYVGSFCQTPSATGCLEKRESWVCFRSRLAKTVMQQARKQLGLGWGTPRDPATEGLTLAQFQSLDFSRMDLTGVIADVAQQAARTGHTPNLGAVQARARARLQQAQAQGDQYTRVDTVTGSVFVGEGQSDAAALWLLQGYGAPLATPTSRALEGTP